MFPAAHANGSQPNQPAAPQLAARVPAQALADIVREETQDGRLIVRFLVSTMQGNLEGAKPSHRLGAARQLISLGFDAAQSFVDSSTRPSGPRSGFSVSTPASSRPESLRHAQQLARPDSTGNRQRQRRRPVPRRRDAGQPNRLQASPQARGSQGASAPRLRPRANRAPACLSPRTHRERGCLARIPSACPGRRSGAVGVPDPFYRILLRLARRLPVQL